MLKREMSRVLQEQRNYAQTYIDDIIIIFSGSCEGNCEFRAGIEELKYWNFTISLDKYKFGQRLTKV